MDSQTILVTALALGVAAGLRPNAKQPVQEAYSGLKQLIQVRYASTRMAADLIEQDPASEALKSAAQEILSKTGAPQDTEILRQAQNLFEAIGGYDVDSARTVGVSLQDVEGANLYLKEILAQGTGPLTGVEISGAKISGDIEISGVQVTSGRTLSTSTSPASATGPARIKILSGNKPHQHRPLRPGRRSPRDRCGPPFG